MTRTESRSDSSGRLLLFHEFFERCKPALPLSANVFVFVLEVVPNRDVCLVGSFADQPCSDDDVPAAFDLQLLSWRWPGVVEIQPEFSLNGEPLAAGSGNPKRVVDTVQWGV